MQKQIGATILIAGGCIGSGIIALPIVLAKIGLISSIVIMLLSWMLIYFSSIINLELHLQVGRGVTLGELGKKFSGKIAQSIGIISFKILSFSLASVYIYGGTSIMQSLFNQESFIIVASIYSIIVAILFMLPIKIIDYVNRFFFIGLITVMLTLIAGLTTEIKWNNLPLFTEGYNETNTWTTLLPVVFTSFGFQSSLPSIINFCNCDKKILKKAFFWGSFIPAFIYIIWTCSTISTIYANDTTFYQKAITTGVEAGDLVEKLSHIAKWYSIQILIWWISLLAVITSLVGVFLSLNDSIKSMIPDNLFSINSKRFFSPIFTVLPAYLLAILIPNAFIAVLGFAGMILVIIAILLPVYLLSKAKKTIICKELKHKELIVLTTLAGIIIVICELLNIF